MKPDNVDGTIPYYYRSLDWEQFVADYPPPPHFHEGVGSGDETALRALQENRALARVREAWSVPFYRDRWSATGLEPGDIRSLSDLEKIPTFTSDDLTHAIETLPPFGSHHPFTRGSLDMFLPLKIQTSGGTTGTPRVTVYDPIAWEVQGIQTARAMWAQGARVGDIVQIPLTAGLANAAWSAYVAAHHWLGCIPLTTGSGAVTSTDQQLQYAFDFGTNGWYSSGEYLAHMAERAVELGFDLHQLPTSFIMGFLGTDTAGNLRSLLEDAWGAPVYDNYGAHEVGLVAFECKEKDGRHVNEDTVYLQTVDVDDASIPLAPGVPGNLVATALHRTVPPIIRYNLRDRLTVLPRTECGCGLKTTRLSSFLGRSDDMIKLRGTNVYPMACQDAVMGDDRTTGEFLCVVDAVGEGLSRREQMTVRVERRSPHHAEDVLRRDLEQALHRDLGVRVEVEIVEAGTLASLTRLGGEGKVRRLLRIGPAEVAGPEPANG